MSRNYRSATAPDVDSVGPDDFGPTGSNREQVGVAKGTYEVGIVFDSRSAALTSIDGSVREDPPI
jgi:hypothetical protein